MKPDEETAYLNYIIPHYGFITKCIFSEELVKRYIRHEPEEKTAKKFLDFAIDPKPISTGIEVTRLEPKTENKNGKIEGPDSALSLINALINELNTEYDDHAEKDSSLILIQIDFDKGLPKKKKLKKLLVEQIKAVLDEERPSNISKNYLIDGSHIWLSTVKTKEDKSPRNKNKSFISLEFDPIDSRFSEGWGDYDFIDLRNKYSSDPFDDRFINQVSKRLDYPIETKTKIIEERLQEFSFLKNDYRHFELVLVSYNLNWRNVGQYVQKALMQLHDYSDSIWNDIIVVDTDSPSYFSLKNEHKFHFPNWKPYVCDWWNYKP